MTKGHRTALLDVNVLIALAWPNHAHHGAAHRWFDDAGRAGWATTPFTESGFVRVSSNRAAIPTATSPALALELLTARMSWFAPLVTHTRPLNEIADAFTLTEHYADGVAKMVIV